MEDELKNTKDLLQNPNHLQLIEGAIKNKKAFKNTTPQDFIETLSELCPNYPAGHEESILNNIAQICEKIDLREDKENGSYMKTLAYLIQLPQENIDIILKISEDIECIFDDEDNNFEKEFLYELSTLQPEELASFIQTIQKISNCSFNYKTDEICINAEDKKDNFGRLYYFNDIMETLNTFKKYGSKAIETFVNNVMLNHHFNRKSFNIDDGGSYDFLNDIDNHIDYDDLNGEALNASALICDKNVEREMGDENAVALINGSQNVVIDAAKERNYFKYHTLLEISKVKEDAAKIISILQKTNHPFIKMCDFKSLIKITNYTSKEIDTLLENISFLTHSPAFAEIFNAITDYCKEKNYNKDLFIQKDFRGYIEKILSLKNIKGDDIQKFTKDSTKVSPQTRETINKIITNLDTHLHDLCSYGQGFTIYYGSNKPLKFRHSPYTSTFEKLQNQDKKAATQEIFDEEFNTKEQKDIILLTKSNKAEDKKNTPFLQQSRFLIDENSVFLNQNIPTSQLEQKQEIKIQSRFLIDENPVLLNQNIPTSQLQQIQEIKIQQPDQDSLKRKNEKSDEKQSNQKQTQQTEGEKDGQEEISKKQKKEGNQR